MVLWAYSSTNGAKGREIESPWKQKKKKHKKKSRDIVAQTPTQALCIKAF